MDKVLKKLFNWNIKELLMASLGIFIFSFGTNVFIVPNHLYNGGILGLSQLIRTIVVDTFHLKTSFDISGLLYLLINIPLFILAFKKISKTFCLRTLYCVLLQTIFLSVIPVPSKLLVEELITSVIIGGAITGVGAGLTLRSSGSTGGTDIIGLAISSNNKKLTVGNISLAFNIVLYGTSGILYGLEIMIYSIVYSFVESMVIDKLHDQNISATAIIFTKKKPDELIDFVKKRIDRDLTYWEAYGGYTKEKTYICYVVCSKYELEYLEKELKDIDENAFVVTDEGARINGLFKKKLTK